MRDKNIARMIFAEEDCDTDTGTVFGSAFMPRFIKKSNRFETSVIIHPDTDSEKEFIKVAQYITSTRKTHPICIGRADISVLNVESVEPLNVEPCKAPVSDYHANIVGWDNEESENMKMADNLAEMANFVKYYAQSRYVTATPCGEAE